MDDWFVKKCPSVANLSQYKLIKNLVCRAGKYSYPSKRAVSARTGHLTKA
jgi:hypothetical protein